MADIFNNEKRSEIMRKVKSKKNKSTELRLIDIFKQNKIFNIYDFRPEHPLDDEQQWHSSSRDDDGNLYMSKLSVDIFAQKIEYICDKLGYKKRTRQENKDHLSTLVKVTPR